jgi:hypothetical protein
MCQMCWQCSLHVNCIETLCSVLQGYMHRGKLLRQVCSLESAEKDFKSVLGLKPDHKSAGKVRPYAHPLSAGVGVQAL